MSETPLVMRDWIGYTNLHQTIPSLCQKKLSAMTQVMSFVPWVYGFLGGTARFALPSSS
jgi:hypothetical protein